MALTLFHARDDDTWTRTDVDLYQRAYDVDEVIAKLEGSGVDSGARVAD